MRFIPQMKQKFFFRIALPLIFLSGLFFLMNKLGSTKYRNEQESKRKFNSKIVKIFRDYENHGTGTILLKNNIKYQVNDNIYDKLNIGDSLIKEKLNLKVIRKDTILNFDLTYKE